MPVRFRPPSLNLTELKQPDPDCASIERVQELYEWGPELGKGSCAVVRQARRLSDGKDVAVKRSAGSDGDQARREMRREYELLKSLSHCNIVSVLECHELKDGFWFCMEFLTDGSLESYIKKEGPMAETCMLSYAKQLLDAVSYLHSKRIIHRDIKPGNILLTDGAETLKIADFGTAKQVAVEGGVMLTDRGTPLYKAPELMNGAVWNERVDVWACGLTIFFMTQATLPWTESERVAQSKLRSGILPAIKWALPVAEDIRGLVIRCLEVDPNLRPPVLELLSHEVFNGLADKNDLTSFGSHEAPELTSGGPSSPMCCGRFSANDWKETRHCDALFRQLAEGITIEIGDSLKTVATQDCKRQTKGRRARKDRSKFFTTHGAKHE